LAAPGSEAALRERRPIDNRPRQGDRRESPSAEPRWRQELSRPYQAAVEDRLHQSHAAGRHADVGLPSSRIRAALPSVCLLTRWVTRGRAAPATRVTTVTTCAARRVHPHVRRIIVALKQPRSRHHQIATCMNSDSSSSIPRHRRPEPEKSCVAKFSQPQTLRIARGTALGSPARARHPIVAPTNELHGLPDFLRCSSTSRLNAATCPHGFWTPVPSMISSEVFCLLTRWVTRGPRGTSDPHHPRSHMRGPAGAPTC
jgi:hypothetical protein